MVKISISELSAELTENELRELDTAEVLPPVFDETSPEMTAEKLIRFKRMRRDASTD